jgi:hypothetical protein
MRAGWAPQRAARWLGCEVRHDLCNNECSDASRAIISGRKASSYSCDCHGYPSVLGAIVLSMLYQLVD